MDKNSLKTAIEDIKKIKTDYERKEDNCQLLIDRLKVLEMDLLDQFYGLMNKPNDGKKPRAKRAAKGKIVTDKPSDNNQIP